MTIDILLDHLNSLLPEYSYTVQRQQGSFAILATNPHWILAVTAPKNSAEVRKGVRAWERDLVQRGGSSGKKRGLVVLVQQPLTGFDATSLGQLSARRDPVHVMILEQAALSMGRRAIQESLDPFLAPAAGLASVLSPPGRQPHPHPLS